MAKTTNAAKDMVRHLNTASASDAGVMAQDIPIKVSAYNTKTIRSADAREGEEKIPAFDSVDHWLRFLAQSVPLQLGIADPFRLARDTGRINTIRQALGAGSLSCELTAANVAAMVKGLELLGFECGQILQACHKVGQLATAATYDADHAHNLTAALCRRVLNIARP